MMAHNVNLEVGAVFARPLHHPTGGPINQANLEEDTI